MSQQKKQKQVENTKISHGKGKIIEGDPKDFERNPMRHHWDAVFAGHPALNRAPYHRGVITQQFRKLKTKILPHNVNQLDKTSYVFLVTSSLPQEGVTCTALNLATSLSLEKDWQTVIIDGCGHKNSLSSQLRGGALLGLMDYLDDAAQLEQIIYPLPSPNLYIMPHGTLNPCRSECFASQKMESLMMATRKTFSKSFIIIDAPATYEFSEAQILSQYCDGIIFVCHKTQTPYDTFMNSIQSLPQEKISGVVLNHASFYSQTAE
tara:strand:+ start:50618 stop:51409 length:792 start_codon:yes stop_codon:yes gene_type:complete